MTAEIVAAVPTDDRLLSVEILGGIAIVSVKGTMRAITSG